MANYANLDYLNVKQLSRYTGFSTSRIYYLVRTENIPFFKIGKSIRFCKETIDGWMGWGPQDEAPQVEDNNVAEVSEDVKVEANNFYIGSIDTVYGTDGEVHIYQGNKELVLDASDLFHWIDSIVRVTIEQKNNTDNLIYDSLKGYINGHNQD